MLQHVQQRGSVIVEGHIHPKDGGAMPVDALFSPIDYEGRPLVLVAVRDISERKRADAELKKALLELAQAKQGMEQINQRLLEANRELQRISQLDGLTGIANRRHFDVCLSREWRRALRNRQTLALILADVDHFKAYNDYYLHQAGDDCLRQIAQALDAAIRRPADLLARYGGEELAAVLPDTSLEGARLIAENMRLAIERLAIPHAKSPTAGHVTLSLGVAVVIPTPATKPTLLIKAADKALFQAKGEGRNRVCGGEIASTGPLHPGKGYNSHC